jgi:hypothetical protein
MKPDEDEGFGPGVMAPGGTGQVFCDLDAEDIISTYLRAKDNCGPKGYEAIAGTSMASPHVAGVAALAYERLGNARNATNARAVIDAIIQNTDDLYTPGYDPMSGYGRVNALKVVNALGSSGPDPDPTPTVTPTPTPTPDPTPTEDPDPEPQQSELEFTEESADAGQYTDTALVETRLTDEEGDPIQGGQVTFKLFGDDGIVEQVASTDEAGLARTEFELFRDPDDYQLLANYAGEEDTYLASETAAPFTIEREDTIASISVQGSGNKRTMHASLVDEDTPMRGVGGATLLFFINGDKVGEAVTGGDGRASLAVPAQYRAKGKSHDFEVVFRGDDHWRASSGATRT